MRTVEFIPVFASLLLFASCSRRDAELRHQITGTWRRDDTFEIALAADGSFVSHWAEPAKRITYQGTWKVRDGDVISSITNCAAQGTTNFEPVGSTHHFTVRQADETDLVWSVDGQTISFKRKR